MDPWSYLERVSKDVEREVRLEMEEEKGLQDDTQWKEGVDEMEKESITDFLSCRIGIAFLDRRPTIYTFTLHYVLQRQ